MKYELVATSGDGVFTLLESFHRAFRPFITVNDIVTFSKARKRLNCHRLSAHARGCLTSFLRTTAVSSFSNGGH